MKKVAVIDDEWMQRKGLVTMTPWESLGCHVVGEAQNARDALEMIQRTRPDIVITDIKMPGMSGLEMIELLRNETNCEFIIISGYGEFAYAKQALQFGVRRYLLKPVDDEELLEAIKFAVKCSDERNKLQKLELEKRHGDMCGEKGDGEFLYKNFGNGKSQEQYVEKAFKFIQAHCQENLTIKTVAEALHISSSYLWKLFSANTSQTFNEYLTMCRIRRSINLLEDGTRKVYQIAEQCGYKDTKYFSQVFKKYMGITPTEYRCGNMRNMK